MRLIEKIILRRLEKDNIIISLEELYKILNIFDCLINYCLEGYTGIKTESHNFLYMPKKWFDAIDKYYYDIFKRILEMKERDLLNYIDYVLLIDGDSLNIHYSENSYLIALLDFLNRVCKSENYLLQAINHDEYLVENIISNYFDAIMSSKIIPDDYKKMISLYNDLINIFWTDEYFYKIFDESDEKVNLLFILNMTYFYFIKNNSFNTDMENVMDFLNDIKDNIELYIDRVKMVNIEIDDYNNLLLFVEFLYHSRNKIMIKK